MKTIAVLAFKGGVTKTTTATHLADPAARFYGKRVLLVDCDLQCQSTKYMGYEPGAQGEVPLGEVLQSLQTDSPIPIQKTYLTTRLENLTLIPGDFALKSA